MPYIMSPDYDTNHIIKAIQNLKASAEYQKKAGVEIVGGVYDDKGRYNQESVLNPSDKYAVNGDYQKYIEDPIVPALNQTLEKLEKIKALNLPEQGAKLNTAMLAVAQNLKDYLPALRKIDFVQHGTELDETREGGNPIGFIETAAKCVLDRAEQKPISLNTPQTIREIGVA